MRGCAPGPRVCIEFGWPGLSSDLAALRAQPQAGSADWHNLMGYTLRKQAVPQLAESEAEYLQALRIDPVDRRRVHA